MQPLIRFIISMFCLILVEIWPIFSMVATPPWKTWKTQGIKKIVKISGKFQGNFNFCGKTLKTQGKCKICDIIVNENVFQQTFLSHVSQGKI